jgi:hypothetical protein
MPLLNRKIPHCLNARSVEALLIPFIPVIKTPVIYLWDGIRSKKNKKKEDAIIFPLFSLLTNKLKYSVFSLLKSRRAFEKRTFLKCP